MAFSITASDGLARCGALLTRNASMVTPTALIYTRRGGCLYLTPDMLEKLRPEAAMLQVNAIQFLGQPGPETLEKFGRSLHHYLGVPSWPLLASNRDPTMEEYGVRPSNENAAYVVGTTGASHVLPEQYMTAIRAMWPDVYVALADEVDAHCRKKRVVAAVDRTARWLDECLAQHQHMEQWLQDRQKQQQQQQQQNGQAAEPYAAGAPAALAPVVGGTFVEERVRSAKAVADKPVLGFALCGFGMGELSEQQPELMKAVIEQLPAEKLRFVVGLASPEEALEAVAQGVDLLDCCYPLHATGNGYALAFAYQEQHSEEDGSAAAASTSGAAEHVQDASAGADDTKINLWSTSYRMDNQPLVKGCTCFACTNHTRAYVHHLLHTHEMLASVLLELHNTHWWLAFFGAMQQAIRAGRFAKYRQWFHLTRQGALVQ